MNVNNFLYFTYADIRVENARVFEGSIAFAPILGPDLPRLGPLGPDNPAWAQPGTTRPDHNGIELGGRRARRRGFG